jgi:HK97 family phage major capsid protein
MIDPHRVKEEIMLPTATRFTEAQIRRARARAFGAEHTRDRTAAPPVDYTQFTDPELRAARDEAMAALDVDGATEDDATRADAITTEIERRNAITTATNERRRRLADLEVTERWRPESGAARPGQRPDDDEGGERGTDQPGDGSRIPNNWRSMVAQGAETWRAGGMRGTAEILHLPEATDLRATVTTTTYPNQPQRLPGVLYPPTIPLSVVDLLDNQTATAGVIEWVVETASPAISNTAIEVAEGQPKPEGTFTFTVQSKALATIAVWVPITRQAAEDNAQLTGYIQGRLSYAVNKRLNGQCLNGDGVAPNIMGILGTVGVQTMSLATAVTMLVALRKMITKVQIAGFTPDGAVLHPTDWETIELGVGTDGQFNFTRDPASLATPRVWGLPVVPTVAIAAGTALVGAFAEAATLWRKQGVRILMSDSHASNFTSNILVILAELRAQLAVYVPPAFCKTIA